MSPAVRRMMAGIGDLDILRIISMPAPSVGVAYIPGPYRNPWEVGSSLLAVPATGKAVLPVNWLPVTSITGEQDQQILCCCIMIRACP